MQEKRESLENDFENNELNESNKFDEEFEKVNVNDNDIFDDLRLYKTTEVAERLGLTPQMLRNILTEFEPYLSCEIKKSGSNHRRFNEKVIQELESILKLRQDRGYTINETKEFLDKSVAARVSIKTTENDKLETAIHGAMESIAQYIVDSEISNLRSENNLLIEENAGNKKELELSKESYQILKDTNTALENEIKMVKDLNEKLKIDYEILLSDNKYIKEQLEATRNATNEEVSNKIDQILKQTERKGFFGFKK